MSARDMPTRAERLAEIDELAEEALRILGTGRGARLDPDALTSLAAACLALGASTVGVYRASGDPARTDSDLLGDTEELENDVAARLQEALDLQQEGRQELTRARAAERAAQADLAHAHAMPVKEKCDGCHAAREAAIARTQRAINEALAGQDCCQDALETLAELITALRKALALLRQVADDLETTYERVYNWLARMAGAQRRVLPKDGDFLTGSDGTSPDETTAGQAASSNTRR